MKNIKYLFFGGMLLFVGVSFYINSSKVQSNEEQLYASIVEKYTQEETDISSIDIKTEDEIKEPKKEKYLYLDAQMSLRTKSYATTDDINKMLDGTALSGMGKTFVEAEEKYNVNALYLVGLACEESDYGRSAFAVKRNNLYGWNAVDSNPDNATYFNSKEEATLYVASKLDKNYLTQGGAYFEGYSAKSIDVHYCTDKEHANKIVNVVNDLLKKLD